MAVVRERIFLVGGSYITSGNTYLGVTRSAKEDISSIDCEPLFITIGHLVGVSDYCFTLECKSFRT